MTMSRRMAAVMAAGLLAGGCAVGGENVPVIDGPARGAQDGGHGTNGTSSQALFDLMKPICKSDHYATPDDYKPGMVVDNSRKFALDPLIESIVSKNPKDEEALGHLMHWGIPEGRYVYSDLLQMEFVGGGGLAIDDTTDPGVSLSKETRNAALTAMAATWNDKSVGVPFLLSGSRVAKDPTVDLTFSGGTLQAQAPADDVKFIVEMGLETHCDGTPLGFHGEAFYSEDLLHELYKLPGVTDRAEAEQKIRDRFCKASGLGNADCPVSVFAMKDYCYWVTGVQYNPAALFCGLTQAKAEVMATMVDPESIPLSY